MATSPSGGYARHNLARSRGSSTKSQTRYYRVVKVHGKFWAKLKLDGEKGSGSQKLFGKDGKGCKEPRDAAICLAEYLDSPGALPSAPPRAPAATHKNGCLTAHGKRLLKKHTEKANDLLGIAMAPEDEAFFAEEAAAAAAPQPVPARGPALIVGAAPDEDTWVVEAQALAVPM